MTIGKEYFLELVDSIFDFEKTFIKMVNTYEKTMYKTKKINDEVRELLKEIPDNEKLLNIDKKVRFLSEELIMFNDYLERLQNGKTTLFNWDYLDDYKLVNLKSKIDNKELINWLKSKLEKNEKIVYSEISINTIALDSKTNSKFKDIINELTLKRNQLLEDKEKVYIFLNSPYDIVGKEITKIYFSLMSNKQSYVELCTAKDFVTYSLLKSEDEFDQEILNSLKENNVLSNLYKIAIDNAANLNEINFKSLERELSEISLEKNLNKDQE